MDSLTQAALGGAVAYACVGRHAGRKAVLWGFALGTLPDLDVFYPYADAVSSFTWHRGVSHSILVHLLLSPLLAWLILRMHPVERPRRHAWTLAIFAVLSTHAVLDALTVYGTQLLWPLTDYPFGWGSLFIIDPLVTLPLLAGLLLPTWRRYATPGTLRANALGLGLCLIYMSWAAGAKLFMDDRVREALAASEDVQTQTFISTPAPFTTLLWRYIVPLESGYLEGYVSVFDPMPDLENWPLYPSVNQYIPLLESDPSFQRLSWFTKGFFGLRTQENKLIFSDLRMGAECAYAFNFIIAEISGAQPVPIPVTRFRQAADRSRLPQVWQRIWDPRVDLRPTPGSRCASPIGPVE